MDGPEIWAKFSNHEFVGRDDGLLGLQKVYGRLTVTYLDGGPSGKHVDTFKLADYFAVL